MKNWERSILHLLEDFIKWQLNLIITKVFSQPVQNSSLLGYKASSSAAISAQRALLSKIEPSVVTKIMSYSETVSFRLDSLF
jgi:hypothetical protein